MDSNAKLGPTIIPGDPKPKSENGKLLENVINDNDLIVVNAEPICQGLITRHRKTINNEEESVIDHVIVCKSMFKLVKNMMIDEAGKYSLTKYTNKTGNNSCTKESDHRTIVIELNVNLNPACPSERIEHFDYKNTESFERFIELTANNSDLENCFDDSDSSEDLENSAKRWLKILKNLIKMSFRKIRVKKNRLSPELEILFKKKEILKTKISGIVNFENPSETAKLHENLDNINAQIEQFCADKNKALVDEYLGKHNDVLEGFSQAKKKLSPKNTALWIPLLRKKTNLAT